jgi:DNA helicase INO80
MLTFWKKNEKEEKDLRKQADKEAIARAKQEEERREAQRQSRKLEFLITQTELYSHFVGNKLKSRYFYLASASFEAKSCHF